MTGEERSRSGSLAGRCEAAVFFLLKSSIGSFERWSRVRLVSLPHEPGRIADPVADKETWATSWVAVPPSAGGGRMAEH